VVTAGTTNELVYRNEWSTHAEARGVVFRYVETFYNRQRRHSTLGYCSPAEYEEKRRAA